MPSFYDFIPTDEPVYDQNEVQTDFLDVFDEEIYADLLDQADQESDQADQPGEGDTFSGGDVTVFDEQDEVIDEETATKPYGDQLGSDDDPEAQEHPGDEAVGDDEDDSSDPAQVDSGRVIDSTDEVRYPEQGQDLQETTYKPPDPLYTIDVIENLEALGIPLNLFTEPSTADIAQELLDWQARDLEGMRNELFEYAIRMLDEQDYLKNELFDYAVQHLDDFFPNDFAVDGEFQQSMDLDFGFMDLDLSDEIEADDLFTTPALLADFGDIVMGIEQDTYLQEFGNINADDV